MAQKTRIDIVNEGMLLAGRDDIADRANVWLQTWLDSVANSWPWPINTREKFAIPVAASTRELVVGNGNGGITQKVLRIFDNIWGYSTDYRSRTRVRIKQFLTQPELLGDTNPAISMPAECRVTQPAGFGSFTLSLNPVPRDAMLLVLDYLELPTALASDSSVPWYPNDATMIQYICARTMLYDNGNDGAYQAAIAETADMVKNDRMRYGTIPGQNDVMQLAAGVYK